MSGDAGGVVGARVKNLYCDPLGVIDGSKGLRKALYGVLGDKVLIR